ncbi:MAG: aminopeptidase [Alkalispirochaeta sp.]
MRLFINFALPPRVFTFLPLQVLLLFLLNSCYTAEQGANFLKDQLRSRRIESAAVRWPEYNPFFEETAQIRRYARDRIGLADTKSYTTFIQDDRDHIVTVVSAAAPLSFERKVWRFPVVGEVPYKGFYNESAALETARKLEREGWETMVRRVGAFSTLGYFRDPLYSYMAEYTPERLAAMLIHEMTHATVWIRDDVSLNEALATFVGDQGALEYLQYRYGPDSPPYHDAVRRRNDRQRFQKFMLELATSLEKLYGTELDPETKQEQKVATIAGAKASFAANYDAWFSDDSYRGFLERTVNNAYIDLYRTYNADIELIEELYHLRGNDLAALVGAFRAVPSDTAPRTLLAEWLTGPSESEGGEESLAPEYATDRNLPRQTQTPPPAQPL